MEKTKVKVTICGTQYTIVSEEDTPEYMQELSATLDENMRQMLEQNPRLSITQAAVLCALDAMDVCKKAESSSENLRSQIQDYLEDAARARTDSEITKRELERVSKELAALRAEKAQ